MQYSKMCIQTSGWKQLITAKKKRIPSGLSILKVWLCKTMLTNAAIIMYSVINLYNALIVHIYVCILVLITVCACLQCAESLCTYLKQEYTCNFSLLPFINVLHCQI